MEPDTWRTGAKILNIGNDCMEDGNKEQGRGKPRLYFTLVGKEENTYLEVRVPHVLHGYPGVQYNKLVPKLYTIPWIVYKRMKKHLGNNPWYHHMGNKPLC